MASWDEKLLNAAREGNIKKVELSVKNGASLECRDRDEWTPLMLAAGYGHLEVVMYLISHGSQLEATSTSDGCTALHLAALFGHIHVTKLLIDQGCSPWVKTKQDQTLYDIVTISRYYSKKEKKEVMDFVKTVMLETPEASDDQDLPRAQRWPFTLSENTDQVAGASNEQLRGTSEETLPISSSETWAGTLAARTFSSAFRIFSKDENLPSANLTELHQDQPKPWVPPPPPDPPNPY